MALLLAFVVMVAMVVACAPVASPTVVATQAAPVAVTQGEAATAFTLTSEAFRQGEMIPRRYTCDEENISPRLQWSQPPSGTMSFALIADDPDAPRGTFVHWVIFNIPADSRSLDEAVPVAAELPDGSRQGFNSAGDNGYIGPCPPSGTHRYFFRLYALDTVLDLPAEAGKEELLAAMEGHILAQAELMGRYSRQ